MAEQEKVIKTLEACGSDICDNCPYYGKDGWCEHDGGMLEGGNGFVEVPRDMLADALALLKAQEPKVLTLEEVLSSDFCWFETRKWKCGDFLIPVIRYKHCDNEYGYTWLDGNDNFYVVSESEYLKTERCWSSRPTDEQREAVSWAE